MTTNPPTDSRLDTLKLPDLAADLLPPMPITAADSIQDAKITLRADSRAALVAIDRALLTLYGRGVAANVVVRQALSDMMARVRAAMHSGEAAQKLLRDFAASAARLPKGWEPPSLPPELIESLAEAVRDFERAKS